MPEPSRQDAIKQVLTERGPMRYSDLCRSQPVGSIQVPLRKLIEKGEVLKDNGFYRLAGQEIPASVLPPKVVIIQPSSKTIQRIRLEEREAMRKELENVRLVLIDMKRFISQAIVMLTPEEYQEETIGERELTHGQES